MHYFYLSPDIIKQNAKESSLIQTGQVLSGKLAVVLAFLSKYFQTCNNRYITYSFMLWHFNDSNKKNTSIIKKNYCKIFYYKHIKSDEGWKATFIT